MKNKLNELTYSVQMLRGVLNGISLTDKLMIFVVVFLICMIFLLKEAKELAKLFFS